MWQHKKHVVRGLPSAVIRNWKEGNMNDIVWYTQLSAVMHQLPIVVKCVLSTTRVMIFVLPQNLPGVNMISDLVLLAEMQRKNTGGEP